MGEEPLGDQSKPSLAIDGDPLKTSDIEVLPRQKKDGQQAPTPKAAAGQMVEMMSMQSGAAALATTFSKLPVAIQQKTLENDAERDRLAYEMEAKHLAAMAADREAERKDRLVRFEKSHARECEGERRAFWFVAGIVGVGAVGTLLLCLAGQWTIATHVINTALAGGLGYQGGKSAGIIKTNKSPQLKSGEPDGDDK